MKEIDHEYTSQITCPYCGWEDKDSWEAGDSGNMECDRCGTEFHFEKDVRVTYSTDKIKRYEDANSW